MGRTLPWKKQGTPAGAAKTASAITSSVVPSSPLESPSPTSPSTPRPRVKRAATRPSPRPKADPDHDCLDDGFGQESPARVPKPLPERLMISGLQHDDRWRMVEDEFVAMAHRFTAHLHAAEYQRLKKLAHDQNADAIRSLSRPVTRPMTNRVTRRQAVVSLQRSQSTSIKKALSRVQGADEDEVDELPWAGTNLEGLMDSPRKKLVPLNRILSTASGTRAAALSRKESLSSPKRSRPSDSVHQAESPTTTRKRSIRPPQVQGEEEEDSEEHSVPWRPIVARSSKSQTAVNTLGSSSTLTQGTSSTAQIRDLKAPGIVAKNSAPAPVTPRVDDDSDSPVETMFGQHFRDRRNKRRVKSSTPNTSREGGNPSDKASKTGPVRSSLSIPSI